MTVFFNEDYMVETFFDVIPFNIYVVDVKTYRLIFLNRFAKSMFGDLKGQTCYSALYEEESPCFHCKFKELLGEDGLPNGNSAVYEHFNPMDDHWYQMQDKALHWPSGNVVMCSIAVDISELKATQNQLAEAHAQLALKNKELEALSITDRLTGVFNRLKLEDVFDQEARRRARYGHTFSVIIMDIDEFKKVNDKHGHPVGDTVLCETARLLTDNIRATDVLGRWGGEEFIIVCPETNAQGAVNLAENLRKKMATHAFTGVEPISGSFGVAEHFENETVTDLIRRADKALYKAKDAGRNKVEVL